MKRLGLNCNLLLATLFLALLGRVSAQDLLKALPPKPVAVIPVIPMTKMSARVPKIEETAPAKPASKNAAVRPEVFRARMLQMFDKNKDGRLDDEERQAARKYAEAHGLTPDGQNRARTAQNRPPPEALRAELRRRFDRNADGKIDDDEMKAVAKGVRARIVSTPLLLQRYDKNADGKIDDAEWQAAEPQLQQWLNEAAAK